MYLHRANKRASLNLLSSLMLVFVSSICMLAMAWGGGLLKKALPEHVETVQVIMHSAIALWLLGTLWVAYRRWRQVQISEKDIRQVLTGLTPDVVIVVNRHRNILMCSEQVQDMFGYQVSEVLGQPTSILYEDRRMQEEEGNSIRRHLRQVGFHIGTAVGRTKSGERIPLELLTGLLQGRSGAVVQIRDVSELMLVENTARDHAVVARKLEQNILQLQEAEQARDSLLQMIVHDMKTPLQVILGNVEMLMDLPPEGMPPEDLSALRSVGGHARRLVSMVNSMLDVSRLEAGEMPIIPGMHDFADLARSAMEAVSLLAGPDRIALVEAEEPCTIYADGGLVQRVVVNLLSNAIRHSPPGEKITLTLCPGQDRHRLEVADHGDGIPIAQQANIFAKFAQVQEGGGRHGDAGTGIGLTFCKLAVQAMGGRIGVNSERGFGSTFWVELPHRTPLDRPPPGPGPLGS